MHSFMLPFGLEARIIELSGVEDNLLTNQKLIKNGETIKLGMANSIKRIEYKDAADMN